jgi:hypothetical protein
MLYGMTRAIIQDLRTTAFAAPKDLSALYDIAMAQPSKKSLSRCRFHLNLPRSNLTSSAVYSLQQRLIRVKLDTTSLKDAAANLIICIENMHREAKERKVRPLVSKDT